MWTTEITNQSDGYIPPAKYQLIHQAVLETCDALDESTKTRVLEDPRRCRFDPQTIVCKGPDAPTCLTAAQVEVARKIYAGPGASLFPGLERGSELGWATLSGPKPMALAAETYQYLVFKDRSGDYLKFDPARDIATADKVIGPTMNSTDPDLKPFFEHGGKLLMYHGWAGPRHRSAEQREFACKRRRHDGEENPKRPIRFVCSWFPAWVTAPAETAPMISTKSAR